MIIPCRFSGYRRDGIRLYPGGGKGGGASADPQVGKALLQQADTADRLVDFVFSSYEENKPAMQELQTLNRRVIDEQLDASQEARARSGEAYDFYKNIGRPAVERSITEARDWDSETNIAGAKRRAIADVQQQTDNAQMQGMRNLQRMGISPNSGKMLALQNQSNIAKATAMAGAAGAADQGRRREGVQLRQQAANLSQGFPAQASGFAGQGAGMGVAAAGVGQGGMQATLAGQGQVMNGLQAGGGMYGNVAAGYQRQQDSINAANANEAAGWGQLLGTGMSVLGSIYMKDGGQVRGPGTGTSDDVPAVNTSNGQPIQLSNGEYVVSADVVKAKGVEFFDKLQERYHRPVNGGGNLRRTA